MSDNSVSDAPRISIVTPSYNQASYIGWALDSVIGQRYPNLEHIVMDGGSIDGSVSKIEARAEHFTHWVSERDGGQAAALNVGFAMSTGDVMGWLNSDDAYLPGSLELAASVLDPAKPQVFHGSTVFLNEEDGSSWIPRPMPSSPLDLEWASLILQPSSFFTRKAWELVGPVREDLHFTMDWDWFIRASRAGVQFISSGRPLSIYRLHSLQKTGSGGKAREEENARIYREYHGPRGEKLFRATRNVQCRSLLMRGALKCIKQPLLRSAVLHTLFPILAFRHTARELESTVRMI